MSEAALTGAEFKQQLREGTPKMGLFLNAHSPTVAEQLAHSGYDWLLVDTQHGPMGYEKLSAMLSAVASGGAKSIVRVGGYDDRPGIQQALDLGADGVLIPYINSAEEARQAISCTKYPRTGTRSVYFPQRSMNKAGLLGYFGHRVFEIIHVGVGGGAGKSHLKQGEARAPAHEFTIELVATQSRKAILLFDRLRYRFFRQ